MDPPVYQHMVGYDYPRSPQSSIQVSRVGYGPADWTVTTPLWMLILIAGAALGAGAAIGYFAAKRR